MSLASFLLYFLYEVISHVVKRQQHFGIILFVLRTRVKSTIYFKCGSLVQSRLVLGSLFSCESLTIDGFCRVLQRAKVMSLTPPSAVHTECLLGSKPVPLHGH